MVRQISRKVTTLKGRNLCTRQHVRQVSFNADRNLAIEHNARVQRHTRRGPPRRSTRVAICNAPIRNGLLARDANVRGTSKRTRGPHRCVFNSNHIGFLVKRGNITRRNASIVHRGSFSFPVHVFNVLQQMFKRTSNNRRVMGLLANSQLIRKSIQLSVPWVIRRTNIGTIRLALDRKTRNRVLHSANREVLTIRSASISRHTTNRSRLHVTNKRHVSSFLRNRQRVTSTLHLVSSRQ